MSVVYKTVGCLFRKSSRLTGNVNVHRGEGCTFKVTGERNWRWSVIPITGLVPAPGTLVDTGITGNERLVWNRQHKVSGGRVTCCWLPLGQERMSHLELESKCWGSLSVASGEEGPRKVLLEKQKLGSW